MYNKLFMKILDSSIWLAPDPHRLVWITFLAAMDEDGHAMFASAGNLAARARVTRKHAEDAVVAFEGPDPDSGDDDNDGRRIERIPGGWLVLNAHKYRAMVTKDIIRAKTRERVARHRARKNEVGNGGVRIGNASLTPSVALVLALSEAEERARKTETPLSAQPPPTTPKPRKRGSAGSPGFDLLWAQYPKKQAKAAAIKAFDAHGPCSDGLDTMLQAVSRQRTWPQWTRDGGQYVPMLATWINGKRWDDAAPSAKHAGIDRDARDAEAMRLLGITPTSVEAIA